MSKNLRINDRELKSLTDTTHIADFDPQVFSDYIDRAVRSNLVMRGLAAIVDDRLVGNPGSSIDIRKIGTLQTVNKTEGEESSYERTDRELVNVKMFPVQEVPVKFTDEAIEDSNIQEIQVHMDEAAESLAKREDQLHYELISGDLGDRVDDGEFDHEDYDDDGDMEFSPHVLEVETDGEVNYSDAKDAKFKEIDAEDYEADSLILHPTLYAELLNDDKFIHANKAGTDEGLRNGYVGRFADLDVYVTTQANEETTDDDAVIGVVIDSDYAFVVADKRRPMMEEYRDTPKGVDKIFARMRFGNRILNEDAICHLVNSGA